MYIRKTSVVFVHRRRIIKMVSDIERTCEGRVPASKRQQDKKKEEEEGVEEVVMVDGEEKMKENETGEKEALERHRRYPFSWPSLSACSWALREQQRVNRIMGGQRRKAGIQNLFVCVRVCVCDCCDE